MAKIAYSNKVTLNTNPEISITNKVQAADMNEIKTSVNTAYDNIDLKAPLASPTFTGTVVLPSTTSMGTVSNTEIGYLDGVTSGIQAQFNGITTRCKIITATRDGVGVAGDVAYTGVGFKPTSIHAFAVVDGTLYMSNGISDNAKISASVYQTSANQFYSGSTLVSYTNQTTWAQSAIVKTYDNDGFTLTWSKAGTPTAGTINLGFICFL